MGLWTEIAEWSIIDTWIVITAILAAMACALPGNFLLLRRQSMMGDALSHTVLPGIVIAFLAVNALLAQGSLSSGTYFAIEHAVLFGGALIVGVLTALLTEWVMRLGRVESSAALGVVFTSLFAVGLLLIRLEADNIHIDPDCVLYGTLETVVLGSPGIPDETKTVGAIFLVNLVLLLLFYKELKVSTFDPQLATAVGINAQWMHYALMGVTAATVVAVFESVGSILVLAMLIAPAATGYLLANRLSWMIVCSLLVAAASAILGHVFALTLPKLFLAPLGIPGISDASTPGMMAVASGLLFLLAALFSPRYGVLSKAVRRVRLTIQIASDDVLGLLYRMEERKIPQRAESLRPLLSDSLGMSAWLVRAATSRLRRRRMIVPGEPGIRLTESGRQAAQRLVRSHRLWESYLARHFDLPEDHLHDSAERAEHFISPNLQDQLATELRRPATDPHGKPIPERPEEEP